MDNVKTILVLDDELELTDFLADCLDDYNVRQFARTDDAINELIANPGKYHACIVDNDVDEIGGGLRLAQTIKQLNIKVKIVMFTGRPMTNGEKASLESNVDYLEKKPVTVRKIREMFP